MANKKQKRYKSKYLKKRKHTTGGMYSDNTVMSAGQGGAGSTSNIVYDESNPAVLQQKLDFLESTKNKIQNTNQKIADQVAADEEQAKIDIENASAESQQKTNAIGAGISGALEAGQQSGIIKTSAGDGLKAGITNSVNAFKTAKAAKLAQKGAVGIKAGVQTAKQAQQTAKALKITQQMASANPIPIGIAAPTVATGTAAGAAANTGAVVSGSANAAGLGAGIANAAKNPNVIAAAANVGGKVIKHYADDDDATTWTAGEATGDILGTAGEYAGYGAMLTSWLGPGAGIGAAVGGIVGAGVGIYKGIAGKRKAKKAEAVAAAKKKVKVDKYNQEVRENLTSAQTSARVGEIQQKTYSGYDLGRNTVAKYGGARYKLGGMNMGMPRYGKAS